ncbi:MAG: SGNH/GDSL hydrolase family protein [Patescibacteria group bacterium]
MRKRIIRTGIVLFSCLGSLLILEILLGIIRPRYGRLAWTEGEEGFFQLDERRIYRLSPSSSYPKEETDSLFYRTNDRGFRYAPEASPAGETKMRILMVGDSFTFGKGVSHEEAYPARVQSILNSTGIPAEVVNAGVPGYGIDQEYRYLTDELIPQQSPDIIVWNLNANDVDDTNKACLYAVRSSTLVPFSGRRNLLYLQGVFAKKSPPMFKKSNIFRFLLYTSNAIIGSDRFTFGCSAPIRGSREVMYRAFREKLAIYLPRVRAALSKRNAKLIITMMPFEYYFDPRRTNDPIIADYHAIQQTLAALSESNVDLNEVIAAQRDPGLYSLRTGRMIPPELPDESGSPQPGGNIIESLYLPEKNPFDGAHLNGLGNNFIAQHVAEVLREALLP